MYILATYIVFLFVKSENIIFIKEAKHVRAFITWWKPFQSLWKFSSRWKLSTASRVFTRICSRILPNIRLGFHRIMIARKTRFNFYMIILVNRILHDRLEMQDFSSRIERYFTRSLHSNSLGHVITSIWQKVKTKRKTKKKLRNRSGVFPLILLCFALKQVVG